MNQSDLIATFAGEAGVSRAEGKRLVVALSQVVVEALNSDSAVVLPGLGKLWVKHKSARTGRNPKTGEAIQIPARRAPAFSASKVMKAALA
jgi:DNA-binding protein HU-beta